MVVRRFGFFGVWVFWGLGFLGFGFICLVVVGKSGVLEVQKFGSSCFDGEER